jgi:hypothetical protein
MLDHWRSEASHNSLLLTCKDLVQAFADGVKASEAFKITSVDYKFIDFVPSEKKDLIVCYLKPASLPMCLTDSHSWVLALHDRRRANLGSHAAASASQALTGIDIRACLVPNFRAPQSATVRGAIIDRIAAADIPAPDGAADDNNMTSNADLPWETKMFRGWRCSYRMERPEEEQPHMYRRRLRRKLAACAGVSHRLRNCPRREAIQTLVAKAEAKAALKRKVRDIVE